MLIVEFGSSVRGDSDAYSDKDILFVSDCYEKSKIAIDEAKEKGYSVSYFGESRFKTMARGGSLFVKHILDEGKILIDDGVFNETSREWSPLFDYSEEIHSNIEISETLFFLPRNCFGDVFAIDFLCSSIRNILIRKLAEMGCYVFSWREVVDQSISYGILAEQDRRAVAFSRTVKNIYRENRCAYLVPGLSNKLLSIFNKITKTNCAIRHVGRRDLIKFSERDHFSKYKTLRSMELVCAEYEFSSDVEWLNSIVSEPNYFCRPTRLFEAELE